MEEARNALNLILLDKKLVKSVLLVYANKQDMPSTMSCQEICNRF